MLVGEAGSVARLMAALEGFTGTPLALAARAVRERIVECAEVQAHCPPGGDCRLPDTIGCRKATAGLDAAFEGLGDDSLLLTADTPGFGRVEMRGRLSAEGRLTGRIELPVGRSRSLWSLLLPAEEAAGPALLADEGALLRLRVRPDGGLDLASLISAGGSAATIYKLKSELFTATALAGTWELAVYQPEEGQLIPPVAIALEFKSRELAVGAMEEFLSQVRESWPVRRTPFVVGEARGACLPNLNLMPDLSPCYVATEGALVAGWNAGSLERALASRPTSSEGRSFAVLYLDRLPEADARLARAGGVTGRPAVAYPWERLEISGSREGNRYSLELQTPAPSR